MITQKYFQVINIIALIEAVIYIYIYTHINFVVLVLVFAIDMTATSMAVCLSPGSVKHFHFLISDLTAQATSSRNFLAALECV